MAKKKNPRRQPLTMEQARRYADKAVEFEHEFMLNMVAFTLMERHGWTREQARELLNEMMEEIKNVGDELNNYNDIIQTVRGEYGLRINMR